jgi:hypothetical protein
MLQATFDASSLAKKCLSAHVYASCIFFLAANANFDPSFLPSFLTSAIGRDDACEKMFNNDWRRAVRDGDFFTFTIYTLKSFKIPALLFMDVLRRLWPFFGQVAALKLIELAAF